MAIAAMSGPKAKPILSRPVNREKSLELIEFDSSESDMRGQIRSKKFTAGEIHLLCFWRTDVGNIRIYACLKCRPSPTEAFYNWGEE